MYTRFQLAKKYLRYYLTASNGKGHGIHSPFIFDFVQHVLIDKCDYPVYQSIEKIRKQLLNNSTVIEVEDFGAGSSVIKTNQRAVSAIAASSLKPKKYAQLLYRMVQYYKPQTIVELGTSFGITTSYLASANDTSKVFTCEGSAAIAAIARRNFQTLQLKNIQLTEGDFAKTLSPLLSSLDKIDFAFIDGNHRKEPTIEYFNQLLNHVTPQTILVFDDIHWSAGMEEAWAAIKGHPAVTLTIDLFFISIVFFNPDFNHKQHFTIRV
ncbi:MAG: class I SAM-dependent methyltransferase [Ferruginibacter sp.]|nr:class I SAM-dependent methyltransferase [Ferruginibacter sp.]